MIKLWRGNSFTEIHGAQPDFLWRLGGHLAVPVKADRRSGPKVGARFSNFFTYQKHDENGEPYNEVWGSLLHGNRVAGGLTPHLEALLKHYGQPYHCQDMRTRPPDRYPMHSGKIGNDRPYQKHVYDQIMAFGVGVIDAAPRSGKTRMAARAIDQWNQPTIYLAPSVAIVRQTYERFKMIFGADYVARLDGQATDEERDIEKHIVIATINSAIKLPPEWFKTRGCAVIDEFHHGAAESYHKFNALIADIFYRVCFTGTHFRTGEDELAMQAICSDVLASVPLDYLTEHKYLAQPRIVFAPVHTPSITCRAWPDVYRQGITENDDRNEMVRHIVTTMQANGIPVLTLVKQRKHADDLGALLPDTAVVKGGEAALTDSVLDDFNAGHISSLVGTSVIGEGVDLPNAAALVYASGGGGSVSQIQGYYRPLTRLEGSTKDVGLIYEFNDQHHQSLLSGSVRRAEFAEKHMGNCVVRL